MKWMPSEIERLYSFLDARDRLYIKLRWRLCPFGIIEKFLPKKGRIVDVGCGYGLLANLIALNSNERQVYGFDLNKRRIAIAQKTVNERKNINFEVKNVKDLKLNSSDAIVMSDFLHHIPYKAQEELINQTSSKLKKDGLMIIQDINNKPLWKYLFASNLDRILNFFPMLYYRNADSWKAMLERNGFAVNIIKADAKLPLPDILLVCRKNKG